MPREPVRRARGDDGIDMPDGFDKLSIDQLNSVAQRSPGQQNQGVSLAPAGAASGGRSSNRNRGRGGLSGPVQVFRELGREAQGGLPEDRANACPAIGGS